MFPKSYEVSITDTLFQATLAGTPDPAQLTGIPVPVSEP